MANIESLLFFFHSGLLARAHWLSLSQFYPRIFIVKPSLRLKVLSDNLTSIISKF